MALAPQIANPGRGGQNCRYDISGLPWDDDRQAYTDGQYFYDSNGLSLDRPDSVVPGLPAADEDYEEFYRTGGGGEGGGNPSSLFSSPQYQQVLAAVNAAAAADAAARRAAIQRALISFGVVPEGFQDKYGDIDELTRSLAQKNTDTGISTHARMLQIRKESIRNFTRGLSAKGLRRSGAKGFGLRKRQLEFDQGYADSLSQLLGGTSGLYNQFAQNEYQRQLALAQALGMAARGVSPSPRPQGSAPPGNSPDWGVFEPNTDLGGYVPNTEKITDYGPPNPYNPAPGAPVGYY